MHASTLVNYQHFFDTYASAFAATGTQVIEIGSQDVNGSLCNCSPTHFNYVGLGNYRQRVTRIRS